MSPGSGLSIRALRSLVVTLLLAASPAAGQSYEETRRALDLTPDLQARSPRLLGMGRLTLLGDEPNNRITLWDFAGNPIGILDDTSSVFELRPATFSTSSVHDRIVPPLVFERQDFASRELRLGLEAWRRGESSTFGVIGELGQLRLDRPYSEDIERRSQFTVPSVMPILGGKMPFLFTEHLRYALRLDLGSESISDRYRRIVRNSIGEYIDRNGDIGEPPDYFTPDHYTIRTIGGGAALGVRLGDPFSAAVAYDRIGLRIKGDNSGYRYDSETEETRPYDVGQVTAVGKIGPLEWGGDARGWRANSDELFVFTISSGPAGAPFTGRGLLLQREERGSSARGRVRWHVGSLELGGEARYGRREVDIIAPPDTDPTSFNAFRNSIHNTPVIADSLTLPDSVISNRTEDRDWEASGGLAWRAPWRGALLAAEYHRGQRELERDIAGIGPRRMVWDVRGGIELPVTAALAVRGGYIHRSEDQDELTARNEYLSNGISAGAGIHPVGSNWTIEAGYLVEWFRADFGDPGQPRGSRQQGALQLRWVF